MTSAGGLKLAPIKKAPLAGAQFNQFVMGEGTGRDNPRLPTIPNESNAAVATDTVLQAVEDFGAVFQRVSGSRV